MKTVILAGGYGTRLSEETERKPKPMVEVGGKPLIWHIMSHYASYGHKEFIVALGYKGEVIKQYFMNYHALRRDMTVCLDSGNIDTDYTKCEDWIVHLIDTGQDVLTGGRLLRLRKLLNNETFMLTYGDGLSNVNLDNVLQLHRKSKSAVTLTSVRPPARFGGIEFDGDNVKTFSEKPQIGEGWINGGFMAMEPDVFDLLKSDDSVLEKDILEKLANKGKVSAYKHDGFWLGCDTLRDKMYLESLWKNGSPPWQDIK